jgi:hypothetical protein
VVWDKELGRRQFGHHDEWMGRSDQRVHNGSYSGSIQENDEKNDANDATRRDAMRRVSGNSSLMLSVPVSKVSKSEVPLLSSASLLAPSTILTAVIRPRIAPGF